MGMVDLMVGARSDQPVFSHQFVVTGDDLGVNADGILGRDLFQLTGANISYRYKVLRIRDLIFPLVVSRSRKFLGSGVSSADEKIINNDQAIIKDSKPSPEEVETIPDRSSSCRESRHQSRTGEGVPEVGREDELSRRVSGRWEAICRGRSAVDFGASRPGVKGRDGPGERPSGRATEIRCEPRRDVLWENEDCEDEVQEIFEKWKQGIRDAEEKFKFEQENAVRKTQIMETTEWRPGAMAAVSDVSPVINKTVVEEGSRTRSSDVSQCDAWSVRLPHDTVVLARGESPVNVIVEGKLIEGNILFEPCNVGIHGVEIAACLWDGREKVFVRMLNVNNSDVVIAKGARLETATALLKS